MDSERDSQDYLLSGGEKFPTGVGEPLPKHAIKQFLQQRYLTPEPAFPKRWLAKCRQQWERDLEFSSAVHVEVSQPRTQLQLVRRGPEGEVVGYKEVLVGEDLTAKNSTSLQRDPGSMSDFVRGRVGFFPFAPGGLESEVIANETEEIANLVENLLSLDNEVLLTTPPGFERGLFFDAKDSPSSHLFEANDAVQPASSVLNIADMMKIDHDDEFGVFENEDVSAGLVKDVETPRIKSPEPVISDNSKFEDIDKLIPKQSPSADVLFRVVPKTKEIHGEKKREWAHVVDINDPFLDFNEKVPEMAIQYPFELDTFQKQAVYHLERGESVFVAAHTSAGKTVVAEYAIALAQKHMTRAIYTSPIKALSNQKFREFRTKFSEVGILTGDVQLKPEASCLIMTTEILRSMLYRGADLIRDVEFVIFDEVHYINDLERGVVWEEVIIMLPEHVNLILLSATVPNTKEFADWVGRTKKKDIYVISTPKRPIPLEHYLFANKEIYKIVDAQSNFLSHGWKAASDALSKHDKEVKQAPSSGRGVRGGARGGRARGSIGRGGGGGRGGNSYHQIQADRNFYIHLTGFLSKKKLLPVIIFAFSKKKCEEYASGLNNTDLNTNSEKSDVHVFIQKSLSRLRGDDRELPQILRMRDLLARGIAVHHGGLLPIIKEMVEILFGKGLVKVLFATETFAMGVNMPARTVVFSGTRKHDGRSFRDLLPGEYTQMSGRAGRRGLDATGMVVISCGENVMPDANSVKTMLLGQPTKLESQFRLTYNMILNLLRVEALKVEEIIKRSFSENAVQKGLPEKQRLFAESEKSLQLLRKLDCAICNPDIDQFYEASARVFDLNRKMMEKIVGSPVASKVLGTGRVVVVNNAFHRNSLAILLKPAAVKSLATKTSSLQNLFLVLMDSNDVTRKDGKSAVEALAPLPATRVAVPDAEAAVHEITSFPYADIAMVTKNVIKIDPEAVLDDANQMKITGATQELLRLAIATQQSGIEENDWSKIKELDFQERLKEKTALLNRMDRFQCTRCPDLNEHYGEVHNQYLLKMKVDELKHTISDQNLELLPDYKQRVDVLKTLNYVDANGTVQLKGRVACEINSADELILTELIFDNVLADFEASEIVALLSCFVFQEKNASEPKLTPKLTKGKEIVHDIAIRVAKIQHKCGLDVDPKDYAFTLKFGLVEVVYEWARGLSFKSITELTDVLEGSIVRCITRLYEVLREVRGAARIIGDSSLYTKMEEAEAMIKRDIVFVASLYF